MKPLAIDLCSGLGGWTEGLLTEGWDVIGFDIERHRYGSHQYPAQLVLQDILTIDGRQFRGHASLIVASPPCQRYSYMAMPWTRAKDLIRWHRDPEHPERIAELNALFDACVRIGREAGCPIVIENVRGAIPWVGRSRWNYGSFHLWGDVPALMPITLRMHNKIESPHLWLRDPKRAGGKYAPNYTKDDATKNSGGSWFNVAHNTESGKGRNPDGRNIHDGERQGLRGMHGEGAVGAPMLRGDDVRLSGVQEGGSTIPDRPATGGHGDGVKVPSESGRRTDIGNGARFTSSKSDHTSSARKAASARIAKMPLPLARHIARVYFPRCLIGDVI